MDLPGKHWQATDGWHIDVRGLSAPDPMVAILGRIRLGGHHLPITVHHDRDPIYLYPELAEIGWSGKIIDGEPGEVRLLLQGPS